MFSYVLEKRQYLVMMDLFDLGSYLKASSLYDATNSKVPVRSKADLNGEPIIEIVFEANHVFLLKAQRSRTW